MSSEPSDEVSIPISHTSSVLEAALDPALVVRAARGELTIIGCNAAFAELSGLGMNDLLRQPAGVMLEDDVVTAILELIASDADSRPVVLRPDAEPAVVNGTSVTIGAVLMEPTAKNRLALIVARALDQDDTDDTRTALLDAVSEPVIITNAKGMIYGGNTAATAVTGLGHSSLTGRDLFELVTPGDRSVVADLLTAELDEPTIIDIVQSDGTHRTVRVDRRDHGRQVVLTLRDLTEQRAQEAELAEMQSVDPLTGLANRLGLFEAIDAIARDGADVELQVAFIDLDNFKTINDALGHDKGDLVLQTVAKRLAQAIGDSGIVARLGGDEFVVVRTAEIGSQAAGLAQLLRAPFVDPIALGTSTFVVSSSAGVAVTSDHAEMNAEHLLKCADLAMYEAKRRGKNTVAEYDESLSRRASERLDIESDLRRAIENGEFELHYQPIMDVVTGRPSGAEALIRWRHPERGLIPPDEFVPIAEQTGLIVPIGSWVVETAVAQVSDWNQRKLARRGLSVSVNVSGLQLADPTLERTIHAALSRSGLDPARLTVEVTESTLMSDADETMELLHRLASLGLGIAIDDFGTGYSSLSYLKRLPARTLKIDKAFIDGLGSIPEDTALVTGIIGLASALDLTLVAEGVETDRQLKELRRLGCEFSQGYLHSKPLPPAEFEEWLGSPEGRTAGRVPQHASAPADETMIPPPPPVDAPVSPIDDDLDLGSDADPDPEPEAVAVGVGTEPSWHDADQDVPFFDQDA